MIIHNLRHRPAVNRPDISVTDIVFDWLRAFPDSSGLCGLEHRVDTKIVVLVNRPAVLELFAKAAHMMQRRDLRESAPSQVHSSFMV